MFRNLRLNIFVYYFLTVAAFLGVLHFLLVVAAVTNLFLLVSVMLSIVALSGVFISKLSIDPLEQYVKNLQNLSKETLHELNLPISTIMTNTHMLKKNLDDIKSLKRIARIESACSMLEQRYNELDYMIKTQSQKSVQEHLDLKELMIQRVDFFHSLYPQIAFVTELHEHFILSDKIGLSKVIDNIIDNAVKYSPNSKKIEIKIYNSTLHIQDYGCGMDEVELLHIFDNYYQSNENMKGFGIGLSMVKRFCDNNRIDLVFKSKPKEGTTVLLHFKEN
ncbi:MAG: HAMP domain-containing sensor histidine kinase [Sulfurimonas sp.]|nr:HAMP domain-containing sensor histidine kinase [Sulfurimonas sp.]MDD3059761.1 HAMP domain-containing sensor histidine kinase [Sulfurimonas sp.]MDD5202075.1 HAMP domain-containing sensor histidine kinase [Sulfurimonas sp.]